MPRVVVKENENLDDALRRFKRQVSRNGTLAEARKREYYVKPGLKRKLKSEAAKFLMIVMCISGFVVSGFEHCVANMGIFVTAGCLVPGVSIEAMVKSMIIVTLGNMVGGAILLAWPLRKMSADK